MGSTSQFWVEMAEANTLGDFRSTGASAVYLPRHKGALILPLCPTETRRTGRLVTSYSIVLRTQHGHLPSVFNTRTRALSTNFLFLAVCQNVLDQIRL